MCLIYIYGLCDPDTEQVMYVGKAEDPKIRLGYHLAKAPKSKSPKDKWIQSLFSIFKKPKLTVIEVCTSDDWVEREHYWMEHYRKVNPSLTNVGAAGLGGAGKINREWRPSVEQESFIDQVKRELATMYDITEENDVVT